jgi:SOS-response transcriptional repressor LexA
VIGAMKQKFTETQGKYLAFIDQYSRLHRRSPSEAAMQDYFGTSPPSVHQMVVTLEKRGLISRVPGKARTIRVLVPSARARPRPEERAPEVMSSRARARS